MMSAKEQPPTETDDNEEGEVALVEKAYLTVVTIIICFIVVTIIYSDCKVINSYGECCVAYTYMACVKRWEGFPTA